MPFLKTPNATLYYDIFEPDFTASPDHPHIYTVLLLHGFASTPESDFAGQLPHLRSRYRVLAPHLHGYGRSSHRNAYSLSFYRDDVEDIITLLNALHLQHVLVLGFSDGGISALLLATLHPNRVQAVAVLGAQPSINAQNVAAIRHWLLEKPMSEEWQAQLAQLHGEPYWRTLPAMYVAGQQALVANGGTIISDQELASIRCPALIMHGIRDKIVPADYARIISEHIPNAQLLLFDAGHAAHLRCEEEYTMAVMNFFAGHTTGAL